MKKNLLLTAALACGIGLSASAENLYRFIIKDPTFIEAHTGLEDVMIEKEIMAYCFRQHKKMRKKLWEN